MYFSIKHVEASSDFTLILTFENGERKSYDMKPYLDTGVFKRLKDERVFRTAHVSFNTVAWDGDIDFDPEALYEGGLPLSD
ncbi:MAG: DUF2442 domain-containing protein [Pyrinomonadaceae bacterium]|nr:DUF2442 domain-containing protein [Pyrinomonadaceae bacterium]MBP6213446.1 DUF2442 domain-containing protein [Pyrinomonadaceae bacterium]